MEIAVKTLSPTARVPVRGSAHAAGLDLFANETVMLRPHTRSAVGTGISMSIPHGYYGRIAERSSLALHNVSVHGGVIDSDYRGEIKVIVSYCGKNGYHIGQGDKIAQLIVTPHASYAPLVVTHTLDATDRQASGFGSTGK